jgi:hypothetical protein
VDDVEKLSTAGVEKSAVGYSLWMMWKSYPPPVWKTLYGIPEQKKR